MHQKKRKLNWAAKELKQKSKLSIEFPWRENKTPYKIYLAENLLVRTRADVVERIFPIILDHYPTIRDLASANEGDLMNLAKPLGLKKRIPYIIKGAKFIVDNFDGIIPQKMTDLLCIPGIGQYTAAAISAFAFKSNEVPADVNIFRFLSRFIGLDIGHKTKGSKELTDLLPLLSQKETKLEAVVFLDFTRIICRSRMPQCQKCVLVKKCVYYEKKSKRITPKKQ